MSFSATVFVGDFLTFSFFLLAHVPRGTLLTHPAEDTHGGRARVYRRRYIIMSQVRVAPAPGAKPAFSLSISSFPESLHPLLRDCDDAGDGNLSLDELTEVRRREKFLAIFKS